MSHAHGRIYHNDSVVAYFEYNGTVDVAISHLCASSEEVWQTWRAKERLDCSCGNPPIAVTLYTEYGDGFYWPGKICLGCRAIVDGAVPEYFEDGCGDGEPV